MINFAKDAWGQVVGIDIHRYSTICVGATRSGKSATTYMCLSRAAQDKSVVIVGIDSSGITLAPFEDAGQSMIITDTSNPAQFVDVLDSLVALMEARTKRLRRLGLDKLQPSEATPTVIIVLEEYAGTLAACEAFDSGVKPADKTKPRVVGAVGRLAREANKCSMYLWMVLQRGDASVVTGDARSQFSRRVTHRLDNRDGVAMLNENATDDEVAKVMQMTPGVALLNEAGEEYRFVKSALITYADYMQHVAANYRPRNDLHLEIEAEKSR